MLSGCLGRTQAKNDGSSKKVRRDREEANVVHSTIHAPGRVVLVSDTRRVIHVELADEFHVCGVGVPQIRVNPFSNFEECRGSYVPMVKGGGDCGSRGGTTCPSTAI